MKIEKWEKSLNMESVKVQDVPKKFQREGKRILESKISQKFKILKDENLKSREKSRKYKNHEKLKYLEI